MLRVNDHGGLIADADATRKAAESLEGTGSAEWMVRLRSDEGQRIGTVPDKFVVRYTIFIVLAAWLARE